MTVDLNGPAFLWRQLQHKVDLGPGGAPVEARLRTAWRSGQQVFDHESLPTSSRHGMPQDGIKIALAQEGMHQTAVAHIDLG